MEQKRREAENIWVEGKPKKWYFALPIVFIWVIIVAIMIKVITNIIK